MLLIVFFLF